MARALVGLAVAAAVLSSPAPFAAAEDGGAGDTMRVEPVCIADRPYERVYADGDLRDVRPGGQGCAVLGSESGPAVGYVIVIVEPPSAVQGAQLAPVAPVAPATAAPVVRLPSTSTD